VPYGLQQLRLIPKSRAGQTVVRLGTWRSRAAARRLSSRSHQNRVELISFDEGATSIVVHCEGEVENEPTCMGRDRQAWGFAPLWFSSARPS
jgi:hypothetical protein